jgi:hypothetical protein
MAKYLLTVPDQLAWRLERWLGCALQIAPPGMADGVPVAGLDAVTEDEIAAVTARLAAGGPQYHAGGPGHPLIADPSRPLSESEQVRWREARDGS